MINFMISGKLMIIHLIVGLMKKILLYKMGYFPKSYIHCKNEIKFELDSSTNPTKFDLKSATDVDTSKFAKKADLTSFKSDAEKLDIDKLKTTD